MPTMPEKTRGEVSDAAVRAATRRTWAEWFTELDAAGAATMRHPAIVAVLAAREELSPWWQQTVAVRYEQARGLRNRRSDSKDRRAVIINALLAQHPSEHQNDWNEKQRARRKAEPRQHDRIAAKEEAPQDGRGRFAQDVVIAKILDQPHIRCVGGCNEDGDDDGERDRVSDRGGRKRAASAGMGC